MAFSDFKNVAEVQQSYHIRYCEEDFVNPQSINPPAQFLEEIKFNRENIDIFTSEAARSEALIFPILREVYKPFASHYAIWIQKSIQADAKLNGTPDYLISTRSELGKGLVAEATRRLLGCP